MSNGTMFVGITGIAFSKEENKLYAVAGLICGPVDCHNPLYTINPATAVAKRVGTGGILTEITRVAVDPTTGTLYGAGYSAFSREVFEFFTIDPKNGNTNGVWSTNFLGVTTMAIDAQGSLFFIETVSASGGVDISRLVRVDKKTGAVISSTVLSHSLGFSAGMVFDPVTGIAYVADGNFHGSNNLYTLNTSTGLLTTVGPTGTAFRFGIGGLSSNPIVEDKHAREDQEK
jgi:DNA-binding beta-propeller fold protein YncE